MCWLEIGGGFDGWLMFGIDGSGIGMYVVSRLVVSVSLSVVWMWWFMCVFCVE